MRKNGEPFRLTFNVISVRIHNNNTIMYCMVKLPFEYCSSSVTIFCIFQGSSLTKVLSSTTICETLKEISPSIGLSSWAHDS
jgi:hypothetical protein